MSGGGDQVTGAHPPSVALLESPRWFLRDLDPEADVGVFSPMSEDSYRRSAFLDNRIVRDGGRDRALPLAVMVELVDRLRPPRPVIHYLFHMGHCGSTLLSRLLGDLPDVLALREPPLLMGLSRSRRALGRPGFPLDPERWEALADLSLVMLGRRWRPAQRVVIKPTSHANDLAPWLMSYTGSERGIVLHAGLETWLATMLRPEVRKENRLYARDFRLADLRRLDPEASTDAGDYGDGELAALNWLLLARELATTLDAPALGRRMLAVDFDAFLDSPAPALAGIAGFLGLAADEESVGRALALHARVNAKTGEAGYGAAARAEALARSRREHSAEIRAGLHWAQAAAGRIPEFARLEARFSPARA